MIPRLLRLKNFFSYREASLDFSGLNTACICGENGAGKSSLLEAISWVVWGKTRTTSEDEIISIGATETRVDFSFELQSQHYRIIRSRRRGQSSQIEFQTQTADGFKPITEKGLRNTQGKIIATIKLDYETFINSAYLRQGRADEFMLKKAGERKKVLIDLLKLDRYETLAKHARDITKLTKREIEIVEQQLQTISDKANTLHQNLDQIAIVDEAIATLRQAQKTDEQQINHWRDIQAQRQVWQQQQTWTQQHLQTLERDRQHHQAEQERSQNQLAQFQDILAQTATIERDFAQYNELQQQLEAADQSSQTHHQLVTQRATLQTAHDRTLTSNQQTQKTLRAQLLALDQQLAEADTALTRLTELTQKQNELQTLRERLKQLDRSQAEVSPLRQRCQQLEAEREQRRIQLETQREQLRRQVEQLQAQVQQRSQLEVQLGGLADHLKHLENQQTYWQRIADKGRERRSFLDQLKAHQQDYEQRLTELAQKKTLTQTPEAACPLCDRPLDQHGWAQVAKHHEEQETALRNQLWVINEQISVSEREISVLRHEYKQIQRELEPYDSLREQRGNLQARLAMCDREAAQIADLQTTLAAIEQHLSTGEYATAIQTELEAITAEIASLDYDDRTHALIRGEVERLRWVEVEFGKLEQIQRQRDRWLEQRPHLSEQLTQAEADYQALCESSHWSQQLAALENELQALDYQPQRHQQLRYDLQALRPVLQQVEALKTAQQQQPVIAQRLNQLQARLIQADQEYCQLKNQLQTLTEQLEQTPDPQPQIQEIEQRIQQRRIELERHLADQGRLAQQRYQLEQLEAQIQQEQERLIGLQRRQLVHGELAYAYGKEGLQALTIETVLPQLEAETNRILSRLSANQLHVQFITQRARKNAKATDPRETLDICIADAHGTRAYETYSGGEAFRINFAIRLALARLLALRSGASLQMLIVDEGFGTQDEQGRERLVAAITAIANDFACILAITHIPSLKEAFQTRIEVTKTQQGSCLTLVT